MKQSLASRLSWLYATLLGITILLVILASSIALVMELTNFTSDIVIAKHEEARILTEQYKAEGLSLQQAAPEIVNALSGIGLRVAVFDKRGRFLAGDKTLRPPVLNAVLSGKEELPPPEPTSRLGEAMEMQHPGGYRAIGPAEPFALTAVDGGFVAFSPSLPLLLVSLLPYWRVVVTLAVISIVLSWFIGRFFARQALRPIADVTDALRALAEGDFTQRRFLAPGGDEIGTLTAAYNDAAANVAGAMANGSGRKNACGNSSPMRDTNFVRRLP